MKKLCMAVLAVFLLMMTGCGGQKAVPDQAASMPEITIGVMPDTDSLPFIIAAEKGFFAEEGVKVNIQQFKSAMDRDAAMQSGNLDGSVSDVLAAAFARSGGFDVRITSLTDGSYKLVAGQGEPAEQVQDLAGHDVAVSRNTVIEYVTDEILKTQGMQENAIHKVVIPQIPTRLEMLQNGKLAAATLPEPMAGIAVQNGCHYITGSDQLGINPGVMLFTTAAVDSKAESIQAMYRAYNKAVDYLNHTERSAYMDLVIEKGGFPPAAKGALNLPVYHEAVLPREQDIAACMQWLKDKNLVAETYSYDDLIVQLLP